MIATGHQRPKDEVWSWLESSKFYSTKAVDIERLTHLPNTAATDNPQRTNSATSTFSSELPWNFPAREQDMRGGCDVIQADDHAWQTMLRVMPSEKGNTSLPDARLLG